MSTIDVRVHSGRDGFDSLRASWDQLAARSATCHFHQSSGWHAAYLDTLESEPDSFRLLAANRDGQLVGVVPLRQRTIALRGLPLRGLEFPLHAHINLSDALLADGENGCPSLREMVAGLEQQREVDWDVLSLPQVPADSCIDRCITSESIDQLVSTAERMSRFVPCDGSPEQVEARLAPEFRRNLRRLARRAEKAGRLDHHLYRNNDDLVTALDEFFRVEASGWKGRLGEGSAINLHPGLRTFYARLIEEFGPKNQCAITLLHLGEHCIAGHFALRMGGVHSILKIGYDEAYAEVAPGNLLMQRVLADCARDPAIHRVSFVTDPPWSRLWRAEGLVVRHHRIYNRTWRGKLGLLANRIVRKIYPSPGERWEPVPQGERNHP